MEGLPHPMKGLPHPMEGLPHPMEGSPHPVKGSPHPLVELAVRMATQLASLQAQLSTAIAGTSNNSDGVANLGLSTFNFQLRFSGSKWANHGRRGSASFVSISLSCFAIYWPYLALI
jgi:hypothetical protein